METKITLTNFRPRDPQWTDHNYPLQVVRRHKRSRFSRLENSWKLLVLYFGLNAKRITTERSRFRLGRERENLKNGRSRVVARAPSRIIANILSRKRNEITTMYTCISIHCKATYNTGSMVPRFCLPTMLTLSD